MIVLNSRIYESRVMGIALAPIWIPVAFVALVFRLLFLALKPLLRHFGYFDSWESSEIEGKITFACMAARNDDDLSYVQKLITHRRAVHDARSWYERLTGTDSGAADRVPLDPELREYLDAQTREYTEDETHDDSDDECAYIDHCIESIDCKKNFIKAASCLHRVNAHTNARTVIM